MSNVLGCLSSFFNLDYHTKGRYIGLDLFRSFSYLMIFVGHGIDIFRETLPSTANYFFLLKDAIEVFFVLSGFLIAKSFLEEFQLNHDRFLLTKRFYLKRWFKTLPSYYLVVAIHIIIGGFLYTELLRDFSYRFLFFIQNLTVSDFYFFPVSYSLAVEEWFYLLFPVLFWSILNLIGKRNVVYIIPIYVVTLVILATATRLYLYYVVKADWDAVLRKSIVSRFDAPAYGVMAAWIYVYHRNIFARYRKFLFLLGIGLFLFQIFGKRFMPDNVLWAVFYFNLIPLSLTFMIPYFYYVEIKSDRIRSVLVYTSLTSYSFYLIHHTPILFTLLHFCRPKSLLQSIFLLILYVVVTLLSTHILYKYFERPVMNLRTKFTG